MAKYGAFKYGSGTKYGTGAAVVTAAPTGELVWILQIDWDGTGFGGYNEAVNMVDLNVSRGRQYYVRSDGSGIEPISAGMANITLEDRAQRYDPYNTTSALYPNVMPGKPVFLMVKEVATGITYPVFYGNITNILPDLLGGRVTLMVEDGLRMVADGELQTPLVYSTTTSGAIDSVLDLIGWKGQRDIKTSTQPVYVFDPAANESPLKLCQELAEANIGAFFMSASGKATFYPCKYNSMTTHTIDNTTTLKEIQLMNPWETVRNKVTVIANRRAKQPLTVIWSYPRTFIVNSGETIIAKYNTAADILTPAPGVDFTANTASDNSGTDVSGSVSVVLSDITTTQCTVTVTNNYGSAVYVSGLRLTGKEIITVKDTASAESTTSITTYGPRKFQLDNRWLQDKAYGQTYATELAAFLDDPTQNPTIRIEQRPSVQFAPELLDYVALSIPSRNIDDTFQVGMIEHKWLTPNGQSVLTTLYLQKTFVYTSDITPDPLYPGTPEIEEVENYNSPLWSNPYESCCDEEPLTPSITCFDYAAPANGPYKISSSPFTMISSADEAGRTFTIPISATIRAFNAEHPSFIEITGLWEFVGENSARSDDGNFWYTVKALDASGRMASTGTIVSVIGQNFYGTSTKRYMVLTATQPVTIAALKFELIYASIETPTDYYGTSILGQCDTPNEDPITDEKFIDYQAHILAEQPSTDVAVLVGDAVGIFIDFSKTLPLGTLITKYGYDIPGSTTYYNDDLGLFTLTDAQVASWNPTSAGFNDSLGDPVMQLSSTDTGDESYTATTQLSYNYAERWIKGRAEASFRYIYTGLGSEGTTLGSIKVTPTGFYRLTVNRVNLYNACA